MSWDARPVDGGVVTSPPDPSFAQLRQAFLRLTGLDLNHYRGRQLDRRLRSFAQRHGLSDLKALGERIARDPRLLQSLKDFITINVSEFFRNPEKFRELRDLVLPELLRTRRRLSVWSAGCAGGAEPYSVAILLDQLTPGVDHEILATDIDRLSLERAARGLYSDEEVRSVPAEVLARYFVGGEEAWELSESIRKRVRFRSHNLLADRYPDGLDLILCRNVVIYFTEEAKDRVYRQFARSLRPSGYLFIGGTETIFKARDYGLAAVRPCFYRKEG